MARTGRRYTGEQIIGILKEAATAKAMGDSIRRHRISAHLSLAQYPVRDAAASIATSGRCRWR
jgi:hypothetical protein